MSYNGSGTFTINSTGQPVVAGTVITASVFNALTADLATGLTTAITKDGQTTTTARIPFAQGISVSQITSAASTALTLQSAGTTAVTIDTLQNVGIGTTSPSAPIDVVSNSSAIGTRIRGRSSDSYGVLEFTNNGASAETARIAADSSNNLIFSNTSSIIERMRIDSSGNVGIGTTSPSFKLDVQRGSDGIVSYFRRSGGTVSPALYVTVNETGNTVGFGTDYSGATSPSMTFTTQGAERMRISSAGIVTMSAYGAGAATFSAAGVISSVSDETWKIKDGVPVDTDSMLNKLNPGYWYYNDEKKETFGSDRQLGFYAQNVNAAIGPEAAPIPEEGKPWGYYDRSVLAITVMSLQKALSNIQELKAINDTQAETINALTARITALENA